MLTEFIYSLLAMAVILITYDLLVNSKNVLGTKVSTDSVRVPLEPAGR